MINKTTKWRPNPTIFKSFIFDVADAHVSVTWYIFGGK